MLREALTWLRTPCPIDARRFGYLTEAVALEARARRCREAWTPHIDHCRQAIRRSLADCAGDGTALVLGSGIALEYPLDELAQRFRRVILADLVHLPSLRRQASAFTNVELLACDLTGVLPALARMNGSMTGFELDAVGLASPALADLDAIDWVLSCNVLSQLPLLPVARLRRRCPRIDDAALDAWGRSLMAHHLDWVVGLAPENCLIADAEQTTLDTEGRVVEHADFAATLGLDAKAYASWEWRLAPPGELGGGFTASHRVVACRL